MEPRKVYITQERFTSEYCRGDGNLYTGYVIGLGYVRPKAGMVYPGNWHGYNSDSAHIPLDKTHCVGLWQYEVDSSVETVIDSLTPLRDIFRKSLVQENGDGNVLVNVGMNQSITYPKDTICNIDFVQSKTYANQIVLQISIEVKDGVRGVIKQEHQIPIKDLGMAFGSNPMPFSKSTTGGVPPWVDPLEFGTGLGGILLSVGEVVGETIYKSNLGIQFNANFEVMNHHRMKVKVDNGGKIWKDASKGSKIWKGVSKSPLVAETLTNKISSPLRYFPRVAPYIEWAGKIGGGVGIGCSVYRFTDAYQNNDELGMLDSGMDTVMGGVGYIPVYGWIISGAYFVVKPLAKMHTETVLKTQVEMGIAGLPATMAFK